MKGVSISHRQPLSPASASTSLSSSSFTTVSDSNRRGTPDSTPASSSGSDGSTSTSNWQTSSNDHRNRLCRTSTSTDAEIFSSHDRDKLLKMLKGVSARIDGNIRSDANTPRDILKRKPPSKRIASPLDIGVKRTKHDLHSRSSSRSTSEGIKKGKARDLGALASASMNLPTLPGRSTGVSRGFSSQLDDAGFMMDVDPPRPSAEVMPPPPILPPKTRLSAPPAQAAYQNISDFSALRPTASLSTGTLVQGTPAPSCYPQPQHKPISQTQNDPPTSSNSPPAPTPKLHPLLDPERKQRRLKLERTISASLASLPSEPSSASNSPSQTTAPPLPPVRQPHAPPPPRTRANHQSSAVLPLSQGRAVNSTSGPPPLGMRRMHTFPLASQNPSASSGNSKVGISPKQKVFKPPLLSSSQPPSTPSTNSSSRSSLPSSDRSSSSSKTSPGTSIDIPSSKFAADEEMDGSLPNSDADISFGDAVQFDVDMDALEEAMSKYD